MVFNPLTVLSFTCLLTEHDPYYGNMATVTTRATAARFHCPRTLWGCQCELTHLLLLATFCKALGWVPILIPFYTWGYIACVISTVIMSCVFIELRASPCFAGSAGNVVKFQNFKSWSSEKQGFPHNEIASGPKWKLLTWSFVTQALGSVLVGPAAFSSSFLHCILPCKPQPARPPWTSNPPFIEEVQKEQVTLSIVLNPRGDRMDLSVRVSLSQHGCPHLLCSCLWKLWPLDLFHETFFLFCLWKYQVVCQQVSSMERCTWYPLHLPLASGFHLQRGRTFWHLLPTCSKIKSQCRLFLPSRGHFH